MVTWTSTLASYTGYSCCRIGDQCDSWLLKELLKKNYLFSPSFFTYFHFRRTLCKDSSAWACCVWPQASAGYPPATGDPLFSCLGQRMDFFFGKADGLGKTMDFTWLSTVTLICVDVSQQKWGDNIRSVANRFRNKHFSCLGLGWFILIKFCF